MGGLDLMKMGVDAFTKGSISTAKIIFERLPENEYSYFMLACCYEKGDSLVAKDYQKAFELMQKSAELGYKDAEFRLGLYYINGWGVEKNDKKCVYWIKKAADHGDASALRYLGSFYREGFVLNRDHHKAENCYLQAIEGGDAAAEYELGVLYSYGKFNKSNEDILGLWKNAAENGVVDAKLKCGDLYYAGIMVDMDYNKAFDFYSEAVSDGSAEAMFKLGGMYMLGHGVETNLDKAAEYILNSAELGYTQAQYQIALMYSTGRFEVENADVVVKEWYERAAEAGHAGAIAELGRIYHEGKGVDVDYDKAIELYNLAADQDDETAQLYLGIMYYQGEGVEQSYEEAVKWISLAANQDSNEAQYFLGVCYLDGQGVAQDYEKAFEWFKKSADQGYALSMYCVARSYKKGLGVRQDDDKAFLWYQRAAEAGNASAQCCMGFCYERGEGVEQDYQKALMWYQKSAEQGDDDAEYNIGRFYELGLGIEPDHEEAIMWYKKAAAKENEEAQGVLCRLGLLGEVSDKSSYLDPEHRADNFKNVILENAKSIYEQMYNSTISSPYSDDLSPISSAQQYSVRTQTYKERLEEERIGFNRSLKVVNKNKGDNAMRQLQEKENTREKRQRIRLAITGIWFLIPAFIEGFISTLFLYMPFFEKFKSVWLEKLIAQNLITDTSVFNIHIGTDTIEQSFLIALVLLLVGSAILNFINKFVCKHMIKKYDNGFLKFCKFIMTTTRIIFIVTILIKLVQLSKF